MPNLTETNEALLALQKELDKLGSATSLINAVREATTNTINVAGESIKAVGALTENAAKLTDRTDGLITRIEDIDFPTRLDAINGAIGGVLTGVQTTQSRLESVERNISDKVQGSQVIILAQILQRLSDAESAIKGSTLERFNTLDNRVESLNNAIGKRTTIMITLLICNILLVVAAIVYQVMMK